MTADGHVWAASANANIASGADEAHRPRRVGRRAQLRARAWSARATPRACRISGDFGFGSTPIVFKAGALRLARGRGGQGRRALPLAAREARRRPGPAARARVPRDALRLARLGSRDAAALPHDDAGLRGSAAGLDALAVTKKCRLRRALDEEPRRSAQCRARRSPTTRWSSRRARGACASTPRPRAGSSRSASSAAPLSPRPSRSAATSRVVTWSRKLMVFRLPPRHR